ncbi:MAG: VOC family protein [Chloroflexi bacterium]|nr:VOC family protein [Chloroflexota bacterium]
MEINHTLIPSKDKLEAAKFFAEIMGLEVGEIGHFAPVRISENFVMDFANSDDVTLWYPEKGHFARMHYAFRVSEEEFEDIFGRVKEKGLKYGSGPGPQTLYDMKVGERRNGRCVYWDDLNGHSMELMTHD